MPGLWTGMEKRRFMKLYTDTKERLFKIFTQGFFGIDYVVVRVTLKFGVVHYTQIISHR